MSFEDAYETSKQFTIKSVLATSFDVGQPRIQAKLRELVELSLSLSLSLSVCLSVCRREFAALDQESLNQGANHSNIVLGITYNETPWNDPASNYISRRWLLRQSQNAGLIETRLLIRASLSPPPPPPEDSFYGPREMWNWNDRSCCSPSSSSVLLDQFSFKKKRLEKQEERERERERYFSRNSLRVWISSLVRAAWRFRSLRDDNIQPFSFSPLRDKRKKGESPASEKGDGSLSIRGSRSTEESRSV